MAAPKLDRARAIRILLDAASLGDRKACEIHKISERTLRNYRARFESDPELAEAFRRRNAVEDRSCRVLRRRVLTATLLAIESKLTDPKTTMGELIRAADVLEKNDLTESVLVGPGDDQPDPGSPEAGGRPPPTGGRSPGHTLH